MSNRWPGGLIRKTPVTPAGPLQNGAAPGIWTLAEASFWTKQGLWPTQGNILAVEDVFSTYLYTGNGSTQTITNGIDLAGKGGLVWAKRRNGATTHVWIDTVRGPLNYIESNGTSGQSPFPDSLTSFTSTGYNVGDALNYNGSGVPMVSWTFREAPNFFDVVTYTGDGSSTRTINHNLGIAAGMVLVKRTDSTGGWKVWHRSISDSGLLNSANLFGTGTSTGEPREGGYVSAASSTTFTLSNGAGAVQQVNASGGTYVAYVFAHDTASDGFIQCGTFTPIGSPLDVTLGWEPQWVLVKDTGTPTSEWQIFDNMRGFPAPGGGSANILVPNTSSAETTNSGCKPTSTGFNFTGSDFRQYIYVAIRRGPMKTPTLGTSVFSPNIFTTNNQKQTAGFPVDMLMGGARAGGGQWAATVSRLQGLNTTTTSAAGYPRLITSSTSAELSGTNIYYGYDNTGFISGGLTGSTPNVAWSFRRAPGFMDVVCYTGTGVARTVAHNLGVAPELMIVKSRSGTFNWMVYSASLGNTKRLFLDLTNAESSSSPTNGSWNDTSPTSSVFSVGDIGAVNASAATFVAYLFASVPGVSKVGSYTGNGSSQTINCAFTTGARYVLIKRTDSTGNWLVWDSARGIVAGNDPYLALNTTAAEVTSDDSVDTDSTGFVVNQVAASNINVNAATYIFLAIA